MANKLLTTPRWLVDEFCAQMAGRLKASASVSRPIGPIAAEYRRVTAMIHEPLAYSAPWPFFVPHIEFDGVGIA